MGEITWPLTCKHCKKSIDLGVELDLASYMEAGQCWQCRRAKKAKVAVTDIVPDMVGDLDWPYYLWLCSACNKRPIQRGHSLCFGCQTEDTAEDTRERKEL